MVFKNSKTAILNKEAETPFLTFPPLSEIPFIKHGFTTRLGGVSEGDFKSMNLSYSVGDDPLRVDENYLKICRSLGIEYKDVVATHQVHKTNVRVMEEKDKGKGLFKPRDYEEVDGFITNTPNLPLATFYADCVPLFFVDVKNHVIGLSHSGWRGTVKRMGKVTIEAMNEHFGTKPADIVAVIGPSICKDCYEVSGDVADEFRKEFTVKEQDLILQRKENDKYQLGLWEANRIILLNAGLQADNIHISGICTCCNSELLFSHRASKGKRGTLAAFLMLREE